MKSQNGLSKELEDRIKEKLQGIELSIECEEAVVRHLFINRRLFDEACKTNQSIDPSVMRKVRQCLDSEKLIAEWTQEYEDLVNLLRVYTESKNHVCVVNRSWDNFKPGDIK